MAFELNIKNIGKLADAKIRIGQFTVLAGPNNTGKSTVSKLLYSVFNGMNANHVEIWIVNLVQSVRLSLENLTILASSDHGDDSPLTKLFDEVEKLTTLVREIPIGDSERLNELIPDLVNRVENMQKMLPDLRSYRNQFINTFEHEERGVMRIEESLNQLQVTLRDIDANKIISRGIQHTIRQNLIQNFQVPTLSDLRGKEDTPSEVDIEHIGKFQFSNEEIGFEIPYDKLRKLQQYSKVIYLESPIHWKLKTALEAISRSSMYWHSRREQLSGVPGYFHDLARALKYQYTGDMAFPDLYQRLIGEDILGGKIVMSEEGNLWFMEKGRRLALSVTAMGVINLGILALLIERKVLDKGTVIFIDEPEAHLHPAWQVVMAKALFELVKQGVHVVIATHSADILKWLEVHVKKNPDDENLIALNKFSTNGDETDEQDFRDKIAAIKQELTKPFADLYTAGL